MKRFIFSLALMLAGTFAFASNAEPLAFPAQNRESVNLEPYSFENADLPEVRENPFFDCTIKANVTIIFNDGTSLTIKNATVTFKDISCGQLLKELMAAA